MGHVGVSAVVGALGLWVQDLCMLSASDGAARALKLCAACPWAAGLWRAGHGGVFVVAGYVFRLVCRPCMQALYVVGGVCGRPYAILVYTLSCYGVVHTLFYCGVVNSRDSMSSSRSMMSVVQWGVKRTARACECVLHAPQLELAW